MRLPLLAPPALALAGGGAVLLYFYPLPAVFIAYNLGLLSLIALDYFLLPRPGDITVRRGIAEIITVGKPASVEVELRIRERGGRKLHLQGKDEPPEHFSALLRLLSLREGGGQKYRDHYRVVPERRGDFTFGRFNLRCRGPLGLVIRQYALCPESSSVKVYPRLKLFTGRELQALASSLRQPGLRASRLVSLGTEFECLREYVPDDDYRQINWKASARSRKLISNHYQAEKSQNLLLVFEAGRMMVTETGSLNKLDHALNAGLLLGHTALLSGDRVGAMAFAQSVSAYLPPEARSGQIGKIAGMLYTLQPRRVEPDYGSAFSYLAQRQKKRSLVCVFTDLIDSRASAELIESAAALGKRHLLLFVVVGDNYLPGTVSAEIRSQGDIYRKAVAEQYLLEREQGIASLRNRGVQVVEMPPGADPIILVGRYLSIKSQVRL
ncbi:MAG: DUF58 domain-containing protein [Firmicutes bacterium]|nr:DUF58 domain-containing protein [Bacillota bacterium]